MIPQSPSPRDRHTERVTRPNPGVSSRSVGEAGSEPLTLDPVSTPSDRHNQLSSGDLGIMTRRQPRSQSRMLDCRPKSGVIGTLNTDSSLHVLTESPVHTRPSIPCTHLLADVLADYELQLHRPTPSSVSLDGCDAVGSRVRHQSAPVSSARRPDGPHPRCWPARRDVVSITPCGRGAGDADRRGAPSTVRLRSPSAVVRATSPSAPGVGLTSCVSCGPRTVRGRCGAS
jgi:hypothetical protein